MRHRLTLDQQAKLPLVDKGFREGAETSRETEEPATVSKETSEDIVPTEENTHDKRPETDID